VIFHGRPLDPHGLCVRVDTEDGIRQSVSHLRERGRSRISLLLSDSGDEFMALRRSGYAAEVAARGQVPEPNLIWSAESETGLPSPQALDQAIAALVEREHADAVIAADDVWAVRLIQRLKARGYRVPQDVAVIGYDNLDLATVIEPALTTVDQDHAAYARAVIKMLQQLTEHGSVEPAARIAVIKPRLVVRESTAREPR
jgi:DNA-binding LacI/PurR family transcriptional regulator